PPKVRATGGAEGNAFDFVLQDDVIAFIARVAQVDPALALGLAKRLFVDSTQLPNVRTAWREIIREFLAWRCDYGTNKGCQATPAQCRGLAETTLDWLKEGGYL